MPEQIETPGIPRKTLISVVTAFYNEASNLPELRRRLEAIARELPREYECELVFVDDHSCDSGAELARSWSIEDPRTHYLRLSRNCGSHAAFSAGLAAAKGECAIILAADLQDPPELIPQLLDQWRAGFDVVWAVRSARTGSSWSHRLAARIYYALIRRWALPNMPKTGSDFVLMDRQVVHALGKISAKNTSLLGLVCWLGFRQTEIEYTKAARHSGQSKWTLGKKIKLFNDSLLSFSSEPLRLFMGMAGSLWLAAFAVLAVAIGRGIVGSPVAGWVWVILAILAVGAMHLTALGILGAYLWRAFDHAQGQPFYVVEAARTGAGPLANELQHGSASTTPANPQDGHAIEGSRCSPNV